MCILSVLYTLLKVLGHYDLSVLPMSVMGFQKKFGWVVSSIPIYLDFWNFFNFAKPLRVVSKVRKLIMKVGQTEGLSTYYMLLFGGVKWVIPDETLCCIFIFCRCQLGRAIICRI